MAARFTTGSKIVTGLTAGQIYRFTATSTQTAGVLLEILVPNMSTFVDFLRVQNPLEFPIARESEAAKSCWS